MVAEPFEIALTTTDDKRYFMALIDGRRVSIPEAQLVADRCEAATKRLRSVIADAYALEGTECLDLDAAVAGD